MFAQLGFAGSSLSDAKYFVCLQVGPSCAIGSRLNDYADDTICLSCSGTQTITPPSRSI